MASGVRFCPGTETFAADDVHATPLGYDRHGLAAGSPLPLPASHELVDRLADCDEVLVSFEGKLGDSLLALAAVRALHDWFALRTATCPPFRVEGPYTGLIGRSGLVVSHQGRPPDGKFAVVGDRASVAKHEAAANASVVCDPAAPPCWSTDGFAHQDMPARYYLALERRLGLRLPPQAAFAPVLTTRENRLVRQLGEAGWFDGLILAAITATSWPQRKDYTAERFVAVAARIAEAQRAQVRLLLIGGSQDGCLRIAAIQAAPGVRALHLDGVPADDLADVFPHCDLVLGNDTGLTHLAALARADDGTGPPVLGLYARHAHSKWRTGLPHHHAVATAFSQRMHQGDLCPVRDALAPESDVHLDAVAPATLARICVGLLEGADQ
jgi:hypothetical protein